jgi:hypothetical protein
MRNRFAAVKPPEIALQSYRVSFAYQMDNVCEVKIILQLVTKPTDTPKSTIIPIHFTTLSRH